MLNVVDSAVVKRQTLLLSPFLLLLCVKANIPLGQREGKENPKCHLLKYDILIVRKYYVNECGKYF